MKEGGGLILFSMMPELNCGMKRGWQGLNYCLCALIFPLVLTRVKGCTILVLFHDMVPAGLLGLVCFP